MNNARMARHACGIAMLSAVKKRVDGDAFARSLTAFSVKAKWTTNSGPSTVDNGDVDAGGASSFTFSTWFSAA